MSKSESSSVSESEATSSESTSSSTAQSESAREQSQEESEVSSDISESEESSSEGAVGVVDDEDRELHSTIMHHLITAPIYAILRVLIPLGFAMHIKHVNRLWWFIVRIVMMRFPFTIFPVIPIIITMIVCAAGAVFTIFVAGDDVTIITVPLPTLFMIVGFGLFALLLCAFIWSVLRTLLFITLRGSDPHYLFSSASTDYIMCLWTPLMLLAATLLLMNGNRIQNDIPKPNPDTIDDLERLFLATFVFFFGSVLVQIFCRYTVLRWRRRIVVPMEKKLRTYKSLVARLLFLDTKDALKATRDEEFSEDPDEDRSTRSKINVLYLALRSVSLDLGLSAYSLREKKLLARRMASDALWNFRMLHERHHGEIVEGTRDFFGMQMPKDEPVPVLDIATVHQFLDSAKASAYFDQKFNAPPEATHIDEPRLVRAFLAFLNDSEALEQTKIAQTHIGAVFCSVVRVVAYCILAIVFLLIMDYDVFGFGVSMVGFFFGLSFIFGDSGRKVWEGFLLHIFLRPFNVNDAIYIPGICDGGHLTVREIGIFAIIGESADGQRWVVSNSTLTGNCMSLRSKAIAASVDLVFDLIGSTTEEQLVELRHRLQKWMRSDHEHPWACDDDEIWYWAPTFKNGFLININLWVGLIDVPWSNGAMRRSARNALMLRIREEVNDMGLNFKSLPMQPVTLTGGVPAPGPAADSSSSSSSSSSKDQGSSEASALAEEMMKVQE